MRVKKILDDNNITIEKNEDTNEDYGKKCRSISLVYHSNTVSYKA